jgi:hypothetical protein
LVQVRGLRKRKNGRWETQIMHLGVRHYLGTFDTAEAALQARNQRAHELSDLDALRGNACKRGKKAAKFPPSTQLNRSSWRGSSLRELAVNDLEASLLQHAQLQHSDKGGPGAAFQPAAGLSSALDAHDPGNSQLSVLPASSSLFHDAHSAGPAIDVGGNPGLGVLQDVQAAAEPSGAVPIPDGYLGGPQGRPNLQSVVAGSLHAPTPQQQQRTDLLRELVHHDIVQTGATGKQSGALANHMCGFMDSQPVAKPSGELAVLANQMGGFMDTQPAAAPYDLQGPPLVDTAKLDHTMPQHVRQRQSGDPLVHAEIATLAPSLQQSISAPFLPPPQQPPPPPPQQQQQQQQQQSSAASQPPVQCFSLAEELRKSNLQCVQALETLGEQQGGMPQLMQSQLRGPPGSLEQANGHMAIQADLELLLQRSGSGAAAPNSLEAMWRDAPNVWDTGEAPLAPNSTRLVQNLGGGSGDGGGAAQGMQPDAMDGKGFLGGVFGSFPAHAGGADDLLESSRSLVGVGLSSRPRSR